jgi:hypothetical protein
MLKYLDSRPLGCSTETSNRGQYKPTSPTPTSIASLRIHSEKINKIKDKKIQILSNHTKVTPVTTSWTYLSGLYFPAQRVETTYAYIYCYIPVLQEAKLMILRNMQA